MLSLTSLASAVPVRLDVLGAVSHTAVPNVVDVGDFFHISIFYNHETPASTSSPTTATYATNHITRLDIGGLSFAGSEGDITVSNNHLICPTRACFILDELTVTARSFDGTIGGYEVDNLFLNLSDFSDTLFDDIVLPAGPSGLDTTSLSYGYWSQVYIKLGDGYDFIGLAIDEVRISAVPLPATAWFLGPALLGLGLVKSRKL